MALLAKFGLLALLAAVPAARAAAEVTDHLQLAHVCGAWYSVSFPHDASPGSMSLQMSGLDSATVAVTTASSGAPRCDDAATDAAALLVSERAANAQLHASRNSIEFFQTPSAAPKDALPVTLYGGGAMRGRGPAAVHGGRGPEWPAGVNRLLVRCGLRVDVGHVRLARLHCPIANAMRDSVDRFGVRS